MGVLAGATVSPGHVSLPKNPAEKVEVRLLRIASSPECP
jgi:hypothetical protein